MRNEDAFAGGRKTYLIKIIILTTTHPLTLSRTCEARAACEGHFLHSFVEYDLVDGTCDRGKEKSRVVNE